MTQSSGEVGGVGENEYRPFPVGYDDPEKFFGLSSQTARDLKIKKFAGHFVPLDRMDDSFIYFLSRPFVSQQEIAALSQTQEILRNDSRVREILSRCLAFLDFLTRGFGESIHSLIQTNHSYENDKKTLKMNELQACGVAQNFISQVNDIQQALGNLISSQPLPEEAGSPSMLQALLSNLDIFLKQVKQIADRIHFYPAKRFLGITLSPLTFEYQKSDEKHGTLGPVSDLCTLSEDLRSLDIKQQEFSYWLRVFCAMAKFQEKCKDWLSETGLQEEGKKDEGESNGVGRFAVEGLHHPRRAYEAKTREGVVSVPQERLVFDPQYKIIVFAGVNGGGKTHVVQAITWAHIMNQVGAPVFGKEGTEVPMVSGILTHQPRDTGVQKKKELEGGDDIGKWGEDLTDLRGLCDQAKPGTLVVIDEMVLATDQSGLESYVQEILHDFVEKGARVLLVTHNAQIIYSLAAQDNCLVFEAGVKDGGKKPTYQFSQRTMETLTKPEEYEAIRGAIFHKIWRKGAVAGAETPSV